ncbi:hypothetical protein MN032_10860 [Agromyces atrinae]|uniref:hypothetical protein n=1 Tax=Agromyces atrinae TaxID=592376 RepID=UPI001F5A32D6|nr:hypothetical protein [Agromyces atrinae]MCI2958197.1 hypothetical protein [Agromyces atrinae]
MKQDLTAYHSATLEEKLAYAEQLAQAGNLIPAGLWTDAEPLGGGLWTPSKPSVSKILYVIETGLTLGLHPLVAIRQLEVIDGVLTIKPALMTALIREAGHTLRFVATGTLEDGDLKVTATGIRSDDPEFVYEYSWTPHDAVRAGLLDSYAGDDDGVWEVTGDNEFWTRYTRRMCQHRATGDIATAAFEDVLMGLHLTPDEVRPLPTAQAAPVEPPAPPRDWKADVDRAKTSQQVIELLREGKALGSIDDETRRIALARAGTLERAEDLARASSDD